MALVKDIKNRLKAHSIRRIINLMANASDKNLIRMTKIAEHLTNNQDIKNQARELRRYFQEGHPSVELGKKVLERLNGNCRKKLINNFFINAGILGREKCEEFRKIEGFEPPWFLLLSPTMRCNLNCKGCSTREFDSATDLDRQVLDRVLNEAKNELGIYFIVTLGGEMFVREDIFDIWKTHNDMYFQIYSNGTLIDREKAKKLAEVGNVTVCFSVEGFEKETDARRGKGVWNKVMEAMDNLKEAGVPYGFSCTMTRYNADIITSDEFIDFMIKKGCIIGCYFQYIPIGKNPDINLMPTPQQRNQLRKMVMRVRNTKPLFLGDFWNDGPYVGGCIAGGRQYLHINNRGEVEPCGFVHFTVDGLNVYEKSLKEILKSPFYTEMRRRVQAQGCQDRYSDNMLTPCMIIDQPWVLRELVEKHRAYATDGGDRLLSGEVARGLDEYSKRIHAIYDKIWEEEYSEYAKKYREEFQKDQEKTVV